MPLFWHFCHPAAAGEIFSARSLFSARTENKFVSEVTSSSLEVNELFNLCLAKQREENERLHQQLKASSAGLEELHQALQKMQQASDYQN